MIVQRVFDFGLRSVLVIAAVCLIAGFIGGRWTCHAPAPRPLTEPEVARLEESGHKRAEEGPVADPTPELPGTAVGQIGVTMRRRSPARGSGTVTESRPEGGGTTSEPGRAGAVSPAAGDSTPPPGEGPAPAPIPLPVGLTSDDLSGSAEVSVRQAGSDLWVRSVLTCCVGRDPATDVCRSELGDESQARFDRALMCGRARLPKAWTLGLGVALPDAEIAASVARYAEGRRLGFYGGVRYSLDPPETSSVERVSGGGECYQQPRFRTLTDQADRLRIEGGVVLRLGQ